MSEAGDAPTVDDDVTDPIIKVSNTLVDLEIPDNEGVICQAVRYNDLEMLKRQLRQGVDINSKQEGLSYRVKSPSMQNRLTITNYAPLHVAVLHCSVEVIEFMLNNGADLNIKDEFNRTCLHFAVTAQRLPVVNFLISKGADLNVQASSGRTPLLESIIGRCVDCTKTLVKAGADLDLADIKGSSPIMMLMAERSVNMELLMLLVKAGANVNCRNNKGGTPLMMAAGLKHTKALQYLIDKGANVNQADNEGYTAIHFLAEPGMGRKREFIAFCLLHNGADLNIRDRKGHTLLWRAVKNANMRLIKLLLLADCQNNIEDIPSHPRLQPLFEHFPEFRDWLHHELNEPKSLKRLCRKSIRNSLHPEKLLQLKSTDLPNVLKDYLLVKDLQVQ